LLSVFRLFQFRFFHLCICCNCIYTLTSFLFFCSFSSIYCSLCVSQGCLTLQRA
jgi:hypothetical protein